MTCFLRHTAERHQPLLEPSEWHGRGRLRQFLDNAPAAPAPSLAPRTASGLPFGLIERFRRPEARLASKRRDDLLSLSGDSRSPVEIYSLRLEAHPSQCVSERGGIALHQRCPSITIGRPAAAP